MSGSFSQDQIRSLVEHSQDMLTAVDSSGSILFINAAAKDMLGYEADALVGTSAFDLIHREDRNRVAERFTDLVDSSDKSMDRIQHRMVHRDGGVLWTESIGSYMNAGTGSEAYVINTRNITEFKAYEAELERQNERLDEFAGIASHDLRNPLNIAQNRLELAREECGSDHLDQIARSHNRIESLITDLLTLAREGEKVGDTEPIDLPTLTRDSWGNVATEATTLDIDADLTIEADPSRLKQLLENLIRNAVKHTGDGVTVSVGEFDDGFYVEDDGPGIPSDERADVFDAGYSTDADGTGFGLSIVKQVAEAHGWDIDVTGGEDGGARFDISGLGV